MGLFNGLIKRSTGTSETYWRMRSAYQIGHRCYVWQNYFSRAPSSRNSECRLILFGDTTYGTVPVSWHWPNTDCHTTSDNLGLCGQVNESTIPSDSSCTEISATGKCWQFTITVFYVSTDDQGTAFTRKRTVTGTQFWHQMCVKYPSTELSGGS